MADKYLRYDWIFTEMNRGVDFINNTLIKAYKDQNEWKRDKEFVERLSNDKEVMLAVANSIILTSKQKEFFFGYMSPALNKDKDFLIKVMIATNTAEKTRVKQAERLAKIDVNKKYLTKEVMEDLVGREEFTIYSEGLDAKLFEGIIAKDANQLAKIAAKNKENPKFVKALIEVLVKSDEEVFKLPAVLEADLKYCEAFLNDKKYVATLKANLRNQAHTRINALYDKFNKDVLTYRNLSEANSKVYYDYFNLLDNIKEDRVALENAQVRLTEIKNELALLNDNKEIKAKNKEIEKQEKEIEKIEKTLAIKEAKCQTRRFKQLDDLRLNTINKGIEIAAKYEKLINEIPPVVEKAFKMALEKKPVKELEKMNNDKLKGKAEEEAAKKKAKEDKEKADKKAKEEKDRINRKGVVVAKYLAPKMEKSMTNLDNAVKGNDGR